MANLFVSLAVPAGNGVGAATDTSDLGAIRTITVEGAFTGGLTVEVSLDAGTTWSPLATFSEESGDQTISVAANSMRVRRSGVDSDNPGSPTVDVGSDENPGEYTSLAVPAGNGTAAGSDISAHGQFQTCQVGGTFTGSVIVQISEDGTDWADEFTFSNPGIQSLRFVAQFARVRRGGIDPLLPGTPVVNLGGINDSGGGGGGADSVYALPETWGQNLIPATQAATAMECLVSTLFADRNAIRAGSIVGIGVRTSANVTEGQLTVVVTIGGVAGTLGVSINGGDSIAEASQDAGIDAYAAGDLIGIKLSTADLLPADTLSCEAWLLVQNDD